MTTSNQYQPINCVFHDYLEHFATLRKPITVRYLANGFETVMSNAIIYDLTGGRNGEYAHLKNNEQNLTIRMDHILSIDNIEAATFNSSYC